MRVIKVLLKDSKCERCILAFCFIVIGLGHASACGLPGSMNECVIACNCGCFKDERGVCRPCDSCYLNIKTGCSKPCDDWSQYVYNAGNDDETYQEFTNNDDETYPESMDNDDGTDPEFTDNNNKTDPKSTKARQLSTSPETSGNAVHQIEYDRLKTFIMVITLVVLKEF